MSTQRRVAVIGGGISGLATAWHLTTSSDGCQGSDWCQVTVLEADTVTGGRIRTELLAGVPVDTGPDALLMRSPAAAAFVAGLGLEPSLRAPAGGGAYLWSRGRLRPLPPGSVFGVPQRLLPLLRSGLLGPAGFVRAGADLVLPRRRPGSGGPGGPGGPDGPDGPDDPTIEELLRPRFGRQVYERLVEPMLGGVHAGRASRLSARSAVPEVAALAERHRSLYLALRARPPAAGAAAGSVAGSVARPPLMTLDGGLGTLVAAARAAVEAAPGARVVTGARVTAIVPRPGGPGAGYRVEGEGFSPVDADDVVLAVPAGDAADLVRPLAPGAAVALDAVPYAGVVTAVLAYHPDDVGPLRGTGFLVPPVEGRLLVGCTWLTAKWPHLTAGMPPGAVPGTAPVLIRAMAGRDGDQAWAGLDDDALVGAIRGELAAAMGLRAAPFAVRVRRIPGAMPQYTTGHAVRVATARRALASAMPGVHLTGAAYGGSGIASCLAQAQQAADAVLARALPVEVRS